MRGARENQQGDSSRGRNIQESSGPRGGDRGCRSPNGRGRSPGRRWEGAHRRGQRGLRAGQGSRGAGRGAEPPAKRRRLHRKAGGPPPRKPSHWRGQGAGPPGPWRRSAAAEGPRPPSPRSGERLTWEAGRERGPQCPVACTRAGYLLVPLPAGGATGQQREPVSLL